MGVLDVGHSAVLCLACLSRRRGPPTHAVSANVMPRWRWTHAHVWSFIDRGGRLAGSMRPRRQRYACVSVLCWGCHLVVLILFLPSALPCTRCMGPCAVWPSFATAASVPSLAPVCCTSARRPAPASGGKLCHRRLVSCRALAELFERDQPKGFREGRSSGRRHITPYIPRLSLHIPVRALAHAHLHARVRRCICACLRPPA